MDDVQKVPAPQGRRPSPVLLAAGFASLALSVGTLLGAFPALLAAWPIGSFDGRWILVGVVVLVGIVLALPRP